MERGDDCKMRTFTYKECVKYSEEKNKIIRAYGDRFNAIYKFFKSQELRNEPISPREAMKQICKIEENFPIMIGDLRDG